MDQKSTKELQNQMCAGAWNLLHNCANLQSDEKLLLVCEDPLLGWYDQKVTDIIKTAAEKFGPIPTVFKVGEPGNKAVPGLSDAINAHDCIIYLARLGDQSRFDEIAPGKRSVMCYIRDAEMLASPFCQTTYQAIKALKNAIDEILISAEKIEITCPNGTRFIGVTKVENRMKKTDVSVFRFPLGVPQPITAAHFSGQVALSRYLTPTGSKVYEPASVPLSKTALAHITNGRITGFSGEENDLETIQSHYKYVSDQFNIDRNTVHSWHAGIHPACVYTADAADNPDRWSNTVFGNPRILHFHTCGDYAPAEISWMIIDQTVSIDGCTLWDRGKLCPEKFKSTAACLEKWPQLKALFLHPAQEIGC